MKIFIIGSVINNTKKNDDNPRSSLFSSTCRKIGKAIANANHIPIICSPFEDSADYYILQGISESSNKHLKIEIYYPDTKQIKLKINSVLKKFKLSNYSYYPTHPLHISVSSPIQYSWLLCQLNALDNCQLVLALGGKLEGSANMLLLLAAARRIPILPLQFLGGASSIAFQRHYYEIEDCLGDLFKDIVVPQKSNNFIQAIERIANRSLNNKNENVKKQRYFISYARARSAEADFVETILRRRNKIVFRDENDFGTASDLPNTIRESIFSADVFIALYCQEYVCSPYCFDELELAIKRKNQNKLRLIILRLDATRMVPPEARDLIFYDVKSRLELEGKIISII